MLSGVSGMMFVGGRGAAGYVKRVCIGIAKRDITCIGGVEFCYPCGEGCWGWFFPMAKSMGVSFSL